MIVRGSATLCVRPAGGSQGKKRRRICQRYANSLDPTVKALSPQAKVEGPGINKNFGSGSSEPALPKGARDVPTVLPVCIWSGVDHHHVGSSNQTARANRFQLPASAAFGQEQGSYEMRSGLAPASNSVAAIRINLGTDCLDTCWSTSALAHSNYQFVMRRNAAVLEPKAPATPTPAA